MIATTMAEATTMPKSNTMNPPVVLTPEKIQRMKEAIKQTDAIFALEGFEPTEQTRVIDAAVLAGRVTRAQVAEEMLNYAIQHKTTDGFVQARAWAWKAWRTRIPMPMASIATSWQALRKVMESFLMLDTQAT
jgi:hypothetical protein